METIAYLSYDGLTDPLGQSQVLPYVKGLAQKGYAITILSFEKKERFNKGRSVIENNCREAGIEWLPFFYTKNPPVLSTLWDIFRLNKEVKKQHRLKNFRIIHCRSYLTALVGLRMKRKYGTGFLFDMRGFWADERVEGKIWSLKNPVFRAIYRFFKRKEKKFLENADYTVSLTHNAEKEIHSWPLKQQPVPIQVIPCCVDLTLFDPGKVNKSQPGRIENELNIPGSATVISYIGSIGTWYMLPEMLGFFKKWLVSHPGSIFLFVTNEPAQIIFDEAGKQGIGDSSIRVKAAARQEVPAYIARSNYSLFFIKPVFSKKASSPTKQGEIMAMGVPLICNSGVGDTDFVVNRYRSGVLVNDFSEGDYERAINELTHIQTFSPQEIRTGAKEFFSLEEGVKKYQEVYQFILGTGRDEAKLS